MATSDEVREALLDKIEKLTKTATAPSRIVELAEAFAWVQSPNQPHGGGN